MPDEFERSIAELAKLAKVPETSRVEFRRLLIEVIDEADISADIDSRRPHVRADDIALFLNRVRRTARNLEKALATLQGYGANLGKRDAAGPAGALLESALEDASVGHGAGTGYLPRLTAYRYSLATLIAATSKAEMSARDLLKPPRGRPSSLGDNLAFRTFVMHLRQIAKKTGGQWTHYRDPIKKWKGSLMPALQILRPCLSPKLVFPKNADLGRVLEHMIKQF